jgi:transcriptional regulator with XRE-family HTH domain
MPDVQKKIKAVRLLRGLTQTKVAELAYLHVKTYQRMEAGTSPVTDEVLETLAVVFNCTADDIRRFNLEINQFEQQQQQALPEEESL